MPILKLIIHISHVIIITTFSVTKHKASTVVNEIKEYLDFPLNFIEIVEPLGRQVQELPVLLLRAIGPPLGLQQLKHKRAASIDIGTLVEEIAADKSFEDTGFAAILAADDGDLRELDRGLEDDHLIPKFRLLTTAAYRTSHIVTATAANHHHHRYKTNR
ncbi:unnamed protein product [Camellia sinensis]